MASVDIVHGLSGHCPWTPVSIFQADIVHGQKSTESMDFLQTGKFLVTPTHNGNNNKNN